MQSDLALQTSLYLFVHIFQITWINMVRVCTFEGCKTSARFNHVGETKGKFCSKHKEAGMIDIVHPHCKVDGCTTLASFNISGQSRGEFCSQHKLVQNTSLPRLSACLNRNSVFNLHRSYPSESLHVITSMGKFCDLHAPLQRYT